MLSLLRMMFIWWRGATPGTMLTTWFSGHAVGTDKFGNRYYQNKAGVRRWVIYNGTVEASRVPPEWHGWLHHRAGEPPTVNPPVHRNWQKPHLPNATGTDAAYRPPGHTLEGGKRASATGDYQAWTPPG